MHFSSQQMCKADLLAGAGAKRILLAYLIGVAPAYLPKCIVMSVMWLWQRLSRSVCVYRGLSSRFATPDQMQGPK